MKASIYVKNRVRQLRQEAGLTQRQLALKANLSPSVVVKLDQPNTIISLEHAASLAKALNCGPLDLLPLELKGSP